MENTCVVDLGQLCTLHVSRQFHFLTLEAGNHTNLDQYKQEAAVAIRTIVLQSSLLMPLRFVIAATWKTRLPAGWLK